MKKVKLVYILSQRYSGSTLLSFLLGTHSDVATIGERRKFFVHSFEKQAENSLKCSCGNPFLECEHWNAIKEALLKRVDLRDHTTNPTEFRVFRNKYLQRLSYELLKFSLIHKLPLLRWPFQKKLKSQGEFNRVLIEESLKKDQAKVFLDSSKVIDHLVYLSLIPELDIHVVWLTRDPRAQVNSALKYND